MFTKQGTAPTTPEINVKILDNTAKARKRRALYKERKERKREAYFVSEYVQLKHPQIYQEIKESYKQFVQRYPSRSDFTKTYFFKKWQKQLSMEKSKLYLPHLPILTSKRQLSTKGKTTSSSPQSSQPSPQQPQQSPQIQIDPPFLAMSLEDMEIAAEEIIRSLQSDRGLMDIVENFEFPEPIWNPDYNIPDYTLETDQDW